MKTSTTKTGKKSTKTTGGLNCRRFDIQRKEWVQCDSAGFCDGVPVFTAGLARQLRGWPAEEAASRLNISVKRAVVLKKQADEIHLPLFDARGRYRNKQASGCEDAVLEMSAVQWRDLNLPPDALQRLLELRKKKGLD